MAELRMMRSLTEVRGISAADQRAGYWISNAALERWLRVNDLNGLRRTLLSREPIGARSRYAATQGQSQGSRCEGTSSSSAKATTAAGSKPVKKKSSSR